MAEKTPEQSIHEGTSDEALVNEVTRRAAGALNAEIAARQMEMTRRNIVALRAFNASSDRWSRILVALTVVLVVFTAALIYLAWALLERGG